MGGHRRQVELMQPRRTFSGAIGHVNGSRSDAHFEDTDDRSLLRELLSVDVTRSFVV
jgi:hypothetical protein